ncbi:MAG TPA: TonB-dependent siderophore receptor [Burkholderiaceae bacterium]
MLALAAAPAWSQTATTPGADSAGTAGAAAAGLVANQSVTIEGEAQEDFGRGSVSLDKLPADLHEVPQSITVLSKSLLQSQGANSLADALRNVPGITLGGAEGGQIGNNINLNGFTARTDLYLDGFRDRGQYYRDTFALDSVEVLMGPSSMLFGRGSTGGAINQVSKVAQLRPVTELELSATTNGLARIAGDIDRRVGDTAAFRVAAMAQEGAPTTRDVMRNRDAGVAPSLRFGIGTGDEITLSALLQANRDMPDYGVSPRTFAGRVGRPVDVPRDTFFGYKDDRTIQDVGALTAQWQHRFGADTILRERLQTNRVHVDARETASQGLLGSGAGGAVEDTDPLSALYVRLQSHDRVIDDHSVFDQADLTSRFDTGPVHHELLAGAELGVETYSNQAYSRTGSGSCDGVKLGTGYVGCELLTQPVHVDSPASAPDVAGNLATSHADSTALYVGDTLAAGPFKLVLGVRRDWFDARVANTIPTASAPASVAQDVAHTSYRGGAIWQPTPLQSYYVSYSTSFDPSLEQLTNTTGATRPLPPASNKAIEGGGRVDVVEGRLSVNGAAFQITQDNARNQQADGTYAATGSVRVRGVRLGASGAPVRGWKVFAGYAWLDAEIVRAIAVGTQGMVPANTPRNSATLWTTWEFLPRFEIGGGAVYQSRRYMNNTNLTEVPGYARIDATLAYRRRDYDVRLNLFNLADRKWYDGIIQSDGGRAVPGTGRSAMLSLSYHL